MATAADYRAAADRAEAAGDTEAAAGLRAWADKIDPPPPKYSFAQILAAADNAKRGGDIEAANGLLAYANSLAPTGQKLVPSQAGSPEALLGYSATLLPTSPQSPKGDTFGDTAGALMEGPLQAAGTFGHALMNRGEGSPSMAAIKADPWLGKLPGPVQSGLGFAGDAAGGALSLLGAGLSGVIGLGTEFVPKQDSAQEQKLGGDLVDMSMFAAPEMSGVSSGAMMTGRAAAPSAGTIPSLGNATIAPTVAARTPAEIGALAQQAARGSKQATQALAFEARSNPEAAAAAERFGVSLPADVLSDNPSVKAAAGLTRSKVASEAEGLWARKVAEVRDRADALIQKIGSGDNIATVSDSVKSSLQSTRQALDDQASALYGEVDAAVKPSTNAVVSNTVSALNKTIEDMGGIEGMTPQERQLYGLVTSDQRVTYARLQREKSLIGKALARQDSPYSSLDKATLSRLYGALADDQMATVSATGDAALAEKLKAANGFTTQRKALEEKMVGVFGKDLEGSIAGKVLGAMKSGVAGDVGGFVRIMKVVPEGLRKDVVVSALSNLSKSRRASQPGFGLAEFSKAWGAIRENKPMRSAIGVQIGPDGMQMLDDLNSVATRIQAADSYVLRTGKANQAIEDAMNANGLVRGVLESSIGKRAAKAASIGAGSLVAGPGGAVAADALTATLMGAKPDMAAKAGKLFASDEFAAAALEAGKGSISPATAERLSRSAAFKAWAKEAGIDDATGWIRSTLSGATPAAAQAANSEQSPYDGLFQRYGQ